MAGNVWYFSNATTILFASAGFVGVALPPEFTRVAVLDKLISEAWAKLLVTENVLESGTSVINWFVKLNDALPEPDMVTLLLIVNPWSVVVLYTTFEPVAYAWFIDAVEII